MRYFEDCAKQAGLEPSFVYTEDIGLTADHKFVDPDNYLIGALFKLYPWEDILRADYADFLVESGTRFIEPAWKSILSNKGVLPLLWQFFEGHPNLLPAYFEDDPKAEKLGGNSVKKPIYSREGANVEIMVEGEPRFARPGPYGEEGAIIQAYQPLPVFEGNHVMIGSWVVGNDPAGIGIREDKTPITHDDARFIPHVIQG